MQYFYFAFNSLSLIVQQCCLEVGTIVRNDCVILKWFKLLNQQIFSLGHPILKGCAAMDGHKCGECGCRWNLHMHCTCEYIKTKRTIIDKNTQSRINNTEEAIEKIKNGLATMKRAVQEYEHELAVIQEISSKFAYILITNSNTVYNKFIEPYLDMQIEEENQKMHSIKGYPRMMYDALVKMKETHQESVNILTKAIENQSHEEVKLEDIELYRDQLYALKHSGPQFRQMISVTNQTQQTRLLAVDRTGLSAVKASRSTGLWGTVKGMFSTSQ